MNDSTLKNQADLSLEKAKEVILQHIPKEEILSIYVKGSYVQNELQPESDVDVVVILKDEKYLPEIYELTNKFGKDIVPNFQIVAYTLKELQTGEKASNRIKNTTPVSLFVKHMSQLPLLYGSKPDGQLFTRTDKKDLTSHISVFNNRFFPDFYNGKFKFNELVKQVLWLTEREQRTLGNTPE